MDSKIKIEDNIICVVGLGYVGLPLAIKFSEFFKVIGFDIDNNKIKKLQKENKKIKFTSDSSEISKANLVIIAVPTPITSSKEPDLSYVLSAAKIIGKNIKKGAIVVFESTVYPGVTEEIVGPIIETESKLKLGLDFKIGYSPERINPGDNEHTIEKITKIVSGMDKESTDKISKIYEKITNVYKTKDIKTAEAAKVIENIQRDLNIALMNELSVIFSKIGLDTKSVLDAAATKWNFYRYEPGLVGGHCIPVDPYYLVYKAKKLGYHPQVILAGRAINDHASKHVAFLAIKGLNQVGKVIKNSKVLIMGLTYKENVADIRESPVKNIIKSLKEFNVNLYGYDPLLDKKQISRFGVIPLDKLNEKVDCVIITVAHNDFKKLDLDEIRKIMNGNPVLIDVRRIYDKEDAFKRGFLYKTL